MDTENDYSLEEEQARNTFLQECEDDGIIFE